MSLRNLAFYYGNLYPSLLKIPRMKPLRIAIAQQNYHIGFFDYNIAKMKSAIDQAISEAADLILFSELCICGYPPRDFLEFNDFLEQSNAAIESLLPLSKQIGILIGAPQKNPVIEGKDLYNAAWLLHEGKVIATVHKTLLPTYDVFDEYRYFEPASNWEVVPFKGHRLAITICEDIWNLGDNPLYKMAPMDELIKQSPDIMLNLSASPFDYDHDDDRKEIIRANVLKYGLPLYYCNAVGSQTEIVFDGGSLVFDAQGNLVHEMAYFEEDFAVIALQTSQCETHAVNLGVSSPFGKDMRVSRIQNPHEIISYLTAERNIAQIHQALILGIRDYFKKMGFTKAILGSSGGIDSAVVLALACEALGADHVKAVLMPSEFSSDHSVKDAEKLSLNLKNPYDIIAIKPVYDAFLQQLDPLFTGTPFNVAEENIQSRTRGNLLMAIANKFGYILLNTSNKSELATGYGTLYGDMAGGLSVLGDVYKMQVYALARYINRKGDIIPENIIEKAPSAELRPNQKDSDSLPPYALLDKVLYQYIERRQGPKELIAMGIEPALVNRILKLVNTAEYKRNQFCPIIRVSCKAFGVGRRLPIVGKYLS
jgi:NAD+ synthase (glutamine-hydrolysing)